MTKFDSDYIYVTKQWNNDYYINVQSFVSKTRQSYKLRKSTHTFLCSLCNDTSFFKFSLYMCILTAYQKEDMQN